MDSYWSSGAHLPQLSYVALLTSICSLTQETSLREIEDLRQRIYHLRGDDRVSANRTPDLAASHYSLSLPLRYLPPDPPLHFVSQHQSSS